MDKSVKRVEWIDFLRGIAIISVVMGHSIWYEYGWVPAMVRSFIYAWYMPLFFFLSGMFFSVKDDFKTFMIKKIKTILVPLVCFTVITTLVDTVYYGMLLNVEDKKWDYVINRLIGIIMQQKCATYNSAFWFLTCLFVCHVFMYLLVKSSKNNLSLIFKVSIVYILGVIYIKRIGVMLPWSLDTACIIIIFVASGYLFDKYKERIMLKAKRSYAILCFVVCCVTTYGNVLYSGNQIDIYSNKIGSPVFFLLQTFFGIMMLIILFYNRNGMKVVNYIGRNSLIFYTFSWIGVIIPNILVYNILKMNIKAMGNWSVIMSMYFAVTVCLCVWPISIVINKYFKFMLGKF